MAKLQILIKMFETLFRIYFIQKLREAFHSKKQRNWNDTFLAFLGTLFLTWTYIGFKLMILVVFMPFLFIVVCRNALSMLILFFFLIITLFQRCFMLGNFRSLKRPKRCVFRLRKIRYFQGPKKNNKVFSGA